MKLTMERMPESQVLLDIAADDDEFAKAMDRAFKKVSRQISVPGFRKGHAPRFIIEQMYGREIFLNEAQQDLMEDLYRKALQQEELVPVGTPDVELVELEPLNFKVTVPVYPMVDPGDYTKVRVEPADASIEEGAVDEVLERIQKSQSPWVDPAKPRTPKEGDQVTIDLKVNEGDEEFEKPIEDAVFVLGESNLFEQLRTEIEKLKVGETVTTDITFPEDDENISERVRGKTLTYTITLKGLKERDPLPLDDELAQTVNESTLEKLREDIETDLHQAKTNEKRNEVVNQIIEKMAEGAMIELPASMIDDAVTEELNGFRMRLAQQRQSLEEYLRLTGQTEDDLREELRPATATRLRNSLLLREIAKREGIEVSDEDIEREVDSIIAATGREEQVREMYRPEGYFRGALRNELFDRRLTDRLIEIATEGKGAVVNGWVPKDETSDEAVETEIVEAKAEAKPAAKKKSASKAKKADDDASEEKAEEAKQEAEAEE